MDKLFVTLPAEPGEVINIKYQPIVPVKYIKLEFAICCPNIPECFLEDKEFVEDLTTGEKLDPNTLLPIDSVVDFTNTKIWE